MNLLVGRGTWYKKVAKTLGPNYTITPTMANVSKINVVINFGLVGERWNKFLTETVPFLNTDVKKINWHLEPDKFKAVTKIALHSNVLTPDCRKNSNTPTYGSLEEYNQWLIKPYYSIGGKGIKLWDGDELKHNEYLQKRIRNRAYELRVHAFKWVPMENWLVFKRTHPAGEAQLTWNFKQGGSFSSVSDSNGGIFKRAKQASLKVLECLNQDFGAVDFICSKDDDPLIPWFIEINSSPGMKIPGVKQAYVSAFNSL